MGFIAAFGRWIMGTWLGRILAALAAFAVVLAIEVARAFRRGKKEARDEYAQQDIDRASSVRQRASDARDRSRADERDADQRLREHGRLRD